MFDTVRGGAKINITQAKEIQTATDGGCWLMDQQDFV